VRFVDI